MEGNIVDFDKKGENIKYSYPSSLQCDGLSCHVGPPPLPERSGQKLHMGMEIGGYWAGPGSGLVFTHK